VTAARSRVAFPHEGQNLRVASLQILHVEREHEIAPKERVAYLKQA
jgi:hypothetical protein